MRAGLGRAPSSARQGTAKRLAQDRIRRAPRRPGRAGDQPPAVAEHAERAGLEAGGRGPERIGDLARVGDDLQPPPFQPMVAAVGRRLRRPPLGRIQGDGGGDPLGRGRLAALERRQPAVSRVKEAGGGRQAVDGARDLDRRRRAELRQGVVQRQQVEQQLQATLGRAAGVDAVAQHHLRQQPLQPRQGLRPQRLAGLAAQRGSQPGRRRRRVRPPGRDSPVRPAGGGPGARGRRRRRRPRPRRPAATGPRRWRPG